MQELRRKKWNMKDLEKCFEMIPKRNQFHFNFVMNVYAKHKMIRRVEELFERMKEEKIRPNDVTYNTLMNAYGTNHIEVEKVLTHEDYKVTPDVTTYTTLMNTYSTNYVEAKRCWSAWRLINSPNVAAHDSDERVQYEPYRGGECAKRMKIDKNTERYNVHDSDERVRYEPYRSGEGVDTHEDW